jgi:hypothetical protein
MGRATPKAADEGVSAEPEQAADPVEQTTDETADEYVARTELGRELMEIRKRIVASGQALLDWDELEREVAERRGGASRRRAVTRTCVGARGSIVAVRRSGMRWRSRICWPRPATR